MHSWLITAAIGTLLSLQMGGVKFDGTGIALVLAIGVGLVGLPHGALDHRMARTLLRGLGPALATVLFCLGYLVVAAVVVIGWILVPLLTIGTFFILSAWHFGLEEDERVERTWLQWIALVARGGMVIWVPATFQTSTTAQLLMVVVPGDEGGVAAAIVQAIKSLAPVLLALSVMDCFWFEKATAKSKVERVASPSFSSSPVATFPTSDRLPEAGSAAGAGVGPGGELNVGYGPSEAIVVHPCESGAWGESWGLDRWPNWQHRIRVLAFAILFANANPLISFGIYFCGWHSVRGLVHLRQEFAGPLGRFVLALLPISTISLLLFVAGFAVVLTNQSLNPAILQTIFIGLSAVAIPHLILHVYCDRRLGRAIEPAGASV